jgi:hypothetical protein
MMIIFDEFEGLDRNPPPTVEDIKKLKERSKDLHDAMSEPLLPVRDSLNDDLENLTC